jgi:hypothetical protein
LVAAATVWWIVVRLDELRRTPTSWPERLQALPVEMALDVLWCGALSAGSARARTLVL